MRTRIPVAGAYLIAVLALFVALGSSGYAGDAVNTVKKIVNADKVDGLHASKKPKPGMLVALGKTGKLPASVVPVVVGPKGDTGAAGLQGEKGEKGDKGETGLTGDVGPTFGFAAADPSAYIYTTSYHVATLNVSLPSAARLFVVARWNARLNCGPTSCSKAFALFVDGTAVPGSEVVQRGIANQQLTDGMATFGLTPTLASGSHVIELRDSPDSGGTLTGYSGGTIGVVALG